ncbi:MAG: hypothetical protein RBR14_05720 [Candidatus Cloacimonas acidaminovorans]|nr:hypothetical protein [Candidatus Cloacimonas acidaminovorans]
MIRAKSRSSAGSFKREFYVESRNREMIDRADMGLIIGDDIMNELEKVAHNQARMLERGTGKLRKCCVCGDVYVNPKKTEIKFGGWLNKNGFRCVYCRCKDIKKPRTKVFRRRREIMKEVWELFLKRKFAGVKITYLNEKV